MKKMYRRILLLAMIAFFFLLMFGFDETASSNSAKQKEFVYDQVNEAAITCYSIEGFYPKDLSYLVEHYGVQIDETVYQVHYHWITDNLHPDIQIFEKGN